MTSYITRMRIYNKHVKAWLFPLVKNTRELLTSSRRKMLFIVTAISNVNNNGNLPSLNCLRYNYRGHD